MNRTFKTGVDREQGSLLPPRVEDYVSADNPVRAIEAYVDGLELAELGFRHAVRGVTVGHPPYNPADLLKLYLYGYLNQIRSSRRLEREAHRNLELIWLLRGLKPGYRTIGKFRAENWAALKAANRTFILLVRDAGLLSGALVAIDGTFFHGDVRKGSITTRKRLAEQLAKLDEDIEAYGIALASNDTEEDREPGGGDGGGDNGDIGQKMAALMAKRAKAQEEIDRFDESGETQLSRTDPDARLLTKRGQTVAGYNVQVAVDEKHKLIVASEVVNDGNDTGQLYPMAKAAQEALGAETLQMVVADTGYYNGHTLKACEDAKIVAYVSQAQRSSRLKKQGRFSHEDFRYDPEADIYRCPAGAALTPSKTLKDNGGRMERCYTSRQADCGACALRERCVTEKTPVRTVRRWEHEDVLERHRARMRDAGDVMRRRSGLVEHPFGTLKRRAGYHHFLVRGFDKVRGEWSLMALCYNLTRVLNILGAERLRELIAALAALLRTPGGIQILLRTALKLAGRSDAQKVRQLAPAPAYQ